MNKTGKSYIGLILLIPLFIILALIIIDTITSYNENKRFKSVTENIITEVLNNEELTEEDYENEIKRLYERNKYETNALVVIPSTYDLYVGNEHSYFGMFTSLKNHTNEMGEIKIFGIVFKVKKNSKAFIKVNARKDTDGNIKFEYTE